MDAADFRAAAEAAKQTELDRLGSSKRLVAVTGADLSTDTVLERAAASEAAASEVFAGWAGDSDGDAADAFEDWAATEREHYERVRDELGEDVAAEPGAVHDFLREQTDPISRAGATVGRGLVAERTLTQFVGYFVNDADEPRADLFRELKADTSEDTERAIELLDRVCESESDWERAEAAALGAIDAAYEEYVDALESMGVDAKSVC
ncbi:rubrerythrin family protein [Halobacterium litoreum]|uniref:Rubrerythrin family protein n=1 Tax=Halobacterium litoreum TaxID=2039234 RepID=A0ABD5NGT5_9EURY|nr:rubrerythrin family protein [Halobacterium litoreum]UHH12630.1 rubrerythrin family protein [Halobacterium litoreum]